MRVSESIHNGLYCFKSIGIYIYIYIYIIQKVRRSDYIKRSTKFGYYLFYMHLPIHLIVGNQSKEFIRLDIHLCFQMGHYIYIQVLSLLISI